MLAAASPAKGINIPPAPYQYAGSKNIDIHGHTHSVGANDTQNHHQKQSNGKYFDLMYPPEDYETGQEKINRKHFFTADQSIAKISGHFCSGFWNFLMKKIQ